MFGHCSSSHDNTSHIHARSAHTHTHTHFAHYTHYTFDVRLYTHRARLHAQLGNMSDPEYPHVISTSEVVISSSDSLGLGLLPLRPMMVQIAPDLLQHGIGQSMLEFMKDGRYAEAQRGCRDHDANEQLCSGRIKTFYIYIYI